MGCYPDIKIVGTSYSSLLAQQFSRSIQRYMDSEPYAMVFPKIALPGGRELQRKARGFKRNADYFEIIASKGFYKGVGVGGSLTGTPVDIAIIDDPVKDAMEAYSSVYRDRTWEWYTSVLLTRLHNESRQLLIMTRWHEDDLAGRILSMERDKWTILSIPALRETADDGNNFDHRMVGEALWEERHSAQGLLEQQQRSPRTFAALYQQHPTVEGGNIVKREWFNSIGIAEFNRIHRGEPIVFFIDTAYTDNTANDPTGIIATCKVGNELYITHGQKVNYRFPELLRFIPQYTQAQGYGKGSSIRIEPKANGISVVDQLKEQTGLNVVCTKPPHDSKETRLCAASPTVEGGRVFLVSGAWNEEFIDEVCGFPVKPHDEFVDLLCYAIDYHINNPYKPIDRRAVARQVY